MATITGRVATGSTSNVTTYASGAFTPVAGEVLVVFASASASTTAAGAFTVSGSANSMTFTRITTCLYNTSADTLAVWISNQVVPGSPVSMTVTLDVTGDAGTGAIVQVIGVSTLNAVGSAAVLKSATDPNRTTGAPVTTFGSSATSGNVVLTCVAEAGSTATTLPTGYTGYPASDTTYATPSERQRVAWSTTVSGTTVTWGAAAGTTGAISIELDTYIPPPPPNIIQAASSGAATGLTSTVTFTNFPTAGSLLVFFSASANFVNPVNAPTDGSHTATLVTPPGRSTTVAAAGSVFTYRCNGTEAKAWTITFDADVSSMQGLEVSADTTTPIDNTPAWVTSASAASMTPTAATATRNGCLALVYVTTDSGETSYTTTTDGYVLEAASTSGANHTGAVFAAWCGTAASTTAVVSFPTTGTPAITTLVILRPPASVTAMAFRPTMALQAVTRSTYF